MPSDGYLFALRPSSPPAGTNLAMVGHPLGNRVSLNQGKIIQKLRVSGVPMIAVQMLGAEGASGSAFVDDAARVVGILQLGYGSQGRAGTTHGRRARRHRPVARERADPPQPVQGVPAG